MKFAVMSDMHGYINFIHELEEQKDTILLIPGDLGEVCRTSYGEHVQILADKYKEVLLVPGNHEYYKGNIHRTHDRLTKLDDSIENFHFLQDNFRIFDDVMIIGSTLWTDFDGQNPLTRYLASIEMNDYKHIRHGPVTVPWQRKLKPEDVEAMHHISKLYIKNAVDTVRETCDTMKVLVMTHHAPSFQSVPEMYIGDKLNGCYCSFMDYYIGELNPQVWVHGHIHQSADYMIGDTRIICNPRGYGQRASENPNFNSNLTFEV